MDRSVLVSLGHSGRNLLFILLRAHRIKSLHAVFLG